MFRNVVFIFLVSISLSAWAKASGYCHSHKYQENKVFKQAESFKEQQLNIFANSKLVATKADLLLSKLLAAKSTAILSWISKRKLNTQKPEELVHTWRRYYAENFVLRKYPQKNAQLNKTIVELVNNIYERSFDKVSRSKFNKLFSEAKKYALSTVADFPLSPIIKQQIQKRINAIHLHWIKDFKNSRHDNNPLDVISWGIAYDPATNKINMGIEALGYNHDDTIVAVFAHEIGHSIDPCRWHAFMNSESPFAKVVSCLRSHDSVAAKKRDDSKINKMVKAGRLSKTLAIALKLNPTCNKREYPPLGVQNDQIDEAFADWFSAEVLIRDTKRISLNSRADLCQPRELVPGSSYPTSADRLTRLFLAPPKIRKILKLPPKGAPRYCSIRI